MLLKDGLPAKTKSCLKRKIFQSLATPSQQILLHYQRTVSFIIFFLNLQLTNGPLITFVKNIIGLSLIFITTRKNYNVNNNGIETVVSGRLEVDRGMRMRSSISEKQNESETEACFCRHISYLMYFEVAILFVRTM